MEKRNKYIDRYLSQDLLYKKIHPSRNAEFGRGCSTFLGILKMMTVGLKNRFC